VKRRVCKNTKTTVLSAKEKKPFAKGGGGGWGGGGGGGGERIGLPLSAGSQKKKGTTNS